MRRGSPDEAAQALRNLLASMGPAGLDPNALSAVMTDNGLRGPEVGNVLRRIWREAAESFLADQSFSDAEISYLKQLGQCLGLSTREIVEIEQALTHPRYRRALSPLLKDAHLTDDEREAISRLRTALRIPDDVHRSTYAEIAGAAVEKNVDAMIADRRLSPDEQRQMEAICANLGVNLQMDGQTRAALDRFALLWRIDNGEIPTIDVPINLQRNESAYWQHSARWHELRTRTVRVNYAGPTASLRIAKGLRFRVGSVSVGRVTNEEMVHIDSGTLYLTSKRLIFVGAKKNTSIRYTAMLGFEVFANGVKIEKERGRSPFLLMDADIEMFGAILGAAMASA